MVSYAQQTVRAKSYIPSEQAHKRNTSSRKTRIQKQMFINIMFTDIYFLIYYQDREFRNDSFVILITCLWVSDRTKEWRLGEKR